MTATNQQPVAEICSASHDDAQFGERAIKPLCDISGFEYGTPLYAGAAPAAVAGWGCEDRSAWYALAMGAAASLEDAANCLRDKDAQKAAMGSATHVRESCNKLWWSVPALEAPAAPAGWKLVPEKPTDAMLGAAQKAWLADPLRRSSTLYAAALAAAPQAQASAPDWWRGRADEIEVQVAATGNSEAMRCYTDMRTLLQAAAAPQAPAQEAPAAESDEMALRRMLCIAYSGALAYMDDGEMQDSRCCPSIDFKRDTVDEIAAKFVQRSSALAAAPQAPAAPILGDAERLAAARQDKSLADYWRNRVAGLAEEFTTAEAALYLADRIVADLYDLPQAGVARPAAPAAPAVDAKAHDWRENASYGGEICAECGAAKGSRRGNAPCAWPPEPLDVCTDPYNCARCKTHPAHRGDMHHAGISRIGGSA